MVCCYNNFFQAVDFSTSSTTILISALLTFSVAGIIDPGFAIYFFATGPSDLAALCLKYALKSVFDSIFTWNILFAFQILLRLKQSLKCLYCKQMFSERYFNISTKRNKKMSHFDFKAIIASRGYIDIKKQLGRMQK